MATEGKPKKKPGSKGGVKHQPGRGHDQKSVLEKKKRFARKAAQRRLQKEEETRKEWAAWEALSDDVKRLLGPAGQPKMPRPRDE